MKKEEVKEDNDDANEKSNSNIEIFLKTYSASFIFDVLGLSALNYIRNDQTQYNILDYTIHGLKTSNTLMSFPLALEILKKNDLLRFHIEDIEGNRLIKYVYGGLLATAMAGTANKCLSYINKRYNKTVHRSSVSRMPSLLEYITSILPRRFRENRFVKLLVHSPNGTDINHISFDVNKRKTRSFTYDDMFPDILLGDQLFNKSNEVKVRSIPKNVIRPSSARSISLNYIPRMLPGLIFRRSPFIHYYRLE